MGLLIDGKWTEREPPRRAGDGSFMRPQSAFRDRIRADGAGGFPAEPGRYHLYVNLCCPWAHRTLIFRALKRLEGAISVSYTEPVMGPEGWTFVGESGASSDDLYGFEHLHQLYTAARPDYTGRVTVPVLWDRERRAIVNNESAEIIRMLNAELDRWGDAAVDLYPEELRDEIDAVNEVVYAGVNNGVYRCGFATRQAAYESAFDALFATLDDLEARLGGRRYLVGARVTEADWRLFPTLARFDAAYHVQFKCNLRRLVDYPNLWAYTRELWQWPGIAATVDLDAIKRGYFRNRSPAAIVPKGPELDFAAPHGRETLGA